MIRASGVELTLRTVSEWLSQGGRRDQSRNPGLLVQVTRLTEALTDEAERRA